MYRNSTTVSTAESTIAIVYVLDYSLGYECRRSMSNVNGK